MSAQPCAARDDGAHSRGLQALGWLAALAFRLDARS